MLSFVEGGLDLLFELSQADYCTKAAEPIRAKFGDIWCRNRVAKLQRNTVQLAAQQKSRGRRTIDFSLIEGE